MKSETSRQSTRKFVRFNCNGNADLMSGEKARCWGQLGDISLGGFYVSTAAPWPINTEVRFKLRVEGKEVCGTGIVATSHPGVGMAIVFRELSDVYQAALESVIVKLKAVGESPSGIGLRV